MISRERLHKANVKAKKRWNNYFSPKWSCDEEPISGVNVPVWQKYRNTGKPCSCSMCGNPRKHFNQKTRQEIKAGYE